MKPERMKYLRELAAEHDVSINIVFELATNLGEAEDYDALVSMVEDYAWMRMDENYE